MRIEAPTHPPSGILGPPAPADRPAAARTRLRAIARVTILGAATNTILAVVKGGVGWAGGSSVLVADAVHSLSDLVSDLLVLISLRLASRPPDDQHPYGHGRFETLGTTALALVLLGAAAGIAWDAWGRFGEAVQPEVTTLWAAAGSIAVKEALYHVTVRVGRRHTSPLVVANAWHHRSDALSSIAALAGITGARMGFPILDPAAAMVVAALIARMAFGLLREAIHEVTDRALQRDMLHELGARVGRLPGVVSLHELRARRMGPRLLVDLHVQVDSSTTVSDGHQVAERVRQFVFEEHAGISEVLVHIDPEPDEHLRPGEDLARPRQELEGEIRRTALTVDGVRAVTHVQIHFLDRRVALQIVIELDRDLHVSQATLVARELRTRLEAIEDVDHADIHLELDDLSHEQLPATLRALRGRDGS